MNYDSPRTRKLIGFGDRMARARGKAGVTQAQLAKMVGKSEAAISNYERGIMEPGLLTALSIADKLGVCFEWLARGAR